MKPLILCIDDDPLVLANHARSLRKHFTMHTALSGEEGIAAIEQGGQYTVILADMRMPGMDGIEFLVRALELSPDTVCAMLTGNSDQETAVRAVNEGHVFRFLNKPCPSSEVIDAIQACYEHHKNLHAKRLVEEKALDGGIRLLSQVLQAANPLAVNRSRVLWEYVLSYYKNIDPAGGVPRDLELAVTFRTIGEVVIPATLVHKAKTGGDLTATEERLVNSAPEVGGQILGYIPGMENVAAIVRYQEKGFDGSGLPMDSVAGEALPFGARLIRVMSGLLRLEASGVAQGTALSLLKKEGHLYDPEILKVCTTRWRPPAQTQFERIRVTIPLTELCISDVLSRPLHTTSGTFVAPEGTVVTKPLLRKIREWQSLQMMPEEVDVSVLRPINPDGANT